MSHGCREKGNFPDCCIASTTSRMCATCLVWLVLRVFDGDAAVAWLKGHTSAQAPRAQYRLSSYRDDHSRHLLSGDVRERVCHAPCQVSRYSPHANSTIPLSTIAALTPITDHASIAFPQQVSPYRAHGYSCKQAGGASRGQVRLDTRLLPTCSS